LTAAHVWSRELAVRVSSSCSAPTCQVNEALGRTPRPHAEGAEKMHSRLWRLVVCEQLLRRLQHLRLVPLDVRLEHTHVARHQLVDAHLPI
jgi:hypothetical protein